MANVFTIPASAPFAEALARGIIAEHGDDPLTLAAITIYLPTRRATRTLADIFARQLGAALLPELRPLGDADEEEFPFDGDADALDLKPAIDPVRRQLLLATLIRDWHGKTRGPIGFAQAAGMAKSLAAFLDDVERQGADLSKLDGLVEAPLAEHWNDVRAFLCLMRDEWPKILEKENRENPAQRRNLMLERLRKSLVAHPPAGKVIAAGSTGSIPATAALLGAIARMPGGMVVLPGLDKDLDEESWQKLDESPGHPQYGLKQLLARIGVDRSAVREWPWAQERNEAREHLLREALRPAPTTDAWQALAERGAGHVANGLRGLSLLQAGHPAEEACAIALALREALETPKQTAALVTPDRTLARRVAAELRRWDIEINDSGGQPLSHTRPGTFLCLLADAVDAQFAPVPLLALLKHPLAANGLDPAEFRRKARMLDRLCLRGPRPDPGLDGIRRAIDGALGDLREEEKWKRADIEAVKRWFDHVERTLRPLEEAFAERAATLPGLIAAHVEAAEALARSNAGRGAALLWRGPAGDAAAKLIAAFAEAAEDLPPLEPDAYAPLFRSLADEIAVRPPFGQHARLSILGPLEARLLRFDITILGGLNEGTWPRAASTDPWLSRPMREALGLEQPERTIGLSAHDFATLAASPRVILSRATKAEGAHTIASRWLQRLVQVTDGLALKISSADQYCRWAGALDEPGSPPKPEERPRPKPPVTMRPRSLSVTEIETWMRDPYAIYAEHVLRLKPLDPLDADFGALERGTAIHKALELFLAETGGDFAPDSWRRLVEIANAVFGQAGVPHSALALWRPRFARAARWFVEEERKRRDTIAKSFVELKGRRTFGEGERAFVLRGRADRIDLLHSGGAAVVDYKTGKPPTNRQIQSMLTAQLPLEAAILSAGGFPDAGPLNAEQLLYIQVSGGAEPGRYQPVEPKKMTLAQFVAEVERKLIALVALFDDENTPYLPRLIPFRADQPGDYDHLARVREWSLIGWEVDEE